MGSSIFTLPYNLYSLSGGMWVILLEISVIPLEIQAQFSLAELTTNHPLDLRVSHQFAHPRHPESESSSLKEKTSGCCCLHPHNNLGLIFLG